MDEGIKGAELGVPDLQADDCRNDQETMEASKNIPTIWHDKPKVMAIAAYVIEGDRCFDVGVNEVRGLKKPEPSLFVPPSSLTVSS